MSTFINISEATTIAVHSLALIANSKQIINANKIARITKFSQNHLSKVLQILVKHNYLSSLRGPTGGFTLIRQPNEISLYEILKLIEGELQSFQCTITCQDCYFDTCLFGNYPHQFTENFQQYLMEKTLGDFKLKKVL
ncbi:MAG: Rrf2 family transcriptional regulator [Bacteroidales bacterium]